MALFDVKRKGKMDGDTKYSRAITVPQYLPNGNKPHISSLFNYKKYSELLRNIEQSNVTQEEKKFLKLAASRHIIFNYAAIADYYANSDCEMQRLMEESALVIIDVDDAIANGYVDLSQRMKELIEESRKVRGK